jgi:DNA-binding MarR family transcriptional regulator
MIQPITQKSDAGVFRPDTRFLETLIGYNARRAALSMIEPFLERMAAYRLRPVEFSVMSVVFHNPGVTSRQLCHCLNILPPNLVKLIQTLEKRKYLERKPHPTDGRAIGLHATSVGAELMKKAEADAAELELEITAQLSVSQRQQLIELLRMIYL